MDEKCPNVDMSTGLRDCWNLSCHKDHFWRRKEIIGKRKNDMKLDTTNWPTIKDKKPRPCTKIILYQEGKFYLIDIDTYGDFSIIDMECNNKYCYEHLNFRTCHCKLRITLDDKWIEL